MKNELTTKLDKYIEDCVLYYDLPSVALGAGICDQNYIYEGVSGYKNIEKKELLKKDDIFHMASVTKLFTSTAIMMLAQQGKLKLDDKMIDILPKASINDKRYKEVTVKHILTHTSGIFESKFLHNPQDKKFVYADLEYDTLGTVIEVVSGLYYDEFINEKILKPLKMDNSEISITLRPGLVSGYEKDEDKKMILAEPFGYCRERAPSSTLTSNILDMRKWAEEVLINKTLVDADTYKFAFDEYVPIPEMQQTMCMSWFKNEQSGQALFGHIGSDPGYRIGFWCCPELNVHFTVMSNITKTPILRMCREVFEILIFNKI
jgi:CubicO group peptidase (beta-lactamase class C family)